MHRRSARARRICACRSSRKKRPHRCALDVHLLTCIASSTLQRVASTVLMLGVLARKLTLRASVEPRKSLGWIKYAENTPRSDAHRLMHRRSARARRIYTCSSSPKKRPHRSALCIRRRPCRWVSGRLNVLMFGVVRKLTLRASGGSVSLSSDAHRRSARARRIYACSSSRKKRPHRSSLCTAAVR